jgi:hypothetical protein
VTDEPTNDHESRGAEAAPAAETRLNDLRIVVARPEASNVVQLIRHEAKRRSGAVLAAMRYAHARSQ